MNMRLASIAIMLLLTTSFALAQESEEELVCEWPTNYVTEGDITAMRQDVAQAKDDSASVRRQAEVNARKLDDLMAREWATTGEVENLTKFVNNSMVSTKRELLESMRLNFGQLVYRLQTVKAQLLILVVSSFLFSLILTNVIHGWRYKELQKQLGIYPRRMPMTPREGELAEQVKKLTEEKEVYAERPGQHSKFITILSILLVAGVTGLIILLIAWSIGAV